ncbi:MULTISPECIES: hypothetical protein [Paenibacillus]|nr:hypothetical protein [Paenibacillus illinoisensis]MCM3203276.1 hypothetical protein [Paenibacillus illinoisensis]
MNLKKRIARLKPPGQFLTKSEGSEGNGIDSEEALAFAFVSKFLPN